MPALIWVWDQSESECCGAFRRVALKKKTKCKDSLKEGNRGITMCEHRKHKGGARNSSSRKTQRLRVYRWHAKTVTGKREGLGDDSIYKEGSDAGF